jgi:outer membrane biosynthesis protein TonB
LFVWWVVGRRTPVSVVQEAEKRKSNASWIQEQIKASKAKKAAAVPVPEPKPMPAAQKKIVEKVLAERASERYFLRQIHIDARFGPLAVVCRVHNCFQFERYVRRSTWDCYCLWQLSCAEKLTTDTVLFGLTPRVKLQASAEEKKAAAKEAAKRKKKAEKDNAKAAEAAAAALAEEKRLDDEFLQSLAPWKRDKLLRQRALDEARSKQIEEDRAQRLAEMRDVGGCF